MATFARLMSQRSGLWLGSERFGQEYYTGRRAALHARALWRKCDGSVPCASKSYQRDLKNPGLCGRQSGNSSLHDDSPVTLKLSSVEKEAGTECAGGQRWMWVPSIFLPTSHYRSPLTASCHSLRPFCLTLGNPVTVNFLSSL